MSTLSYLNDRADPRVQAALKRQCSICHAKRNRTPHGSVIA